MRDSSHKVVTALTGIYLGALVVLAFVQWSEGAECPWYLDILAFVPVGVLLTLLFGRRRWIIAVAFGVLGVAWIEAAQAIWMPEGYGRVEDSLWGSLGVILGVIATLGILKFIRSHNSFSIVTEAGRREIPQD